VEFTTHIITSSAVDASSVYAVDVDGDGDMDVLSTSRFDDKIAWYKNDGNENFTTHIITTSADGASSVYAVDVDGDGDMDVLSASQLDDKIAWYENDGNENFTIHIITTSTNGPFSVFAVDVDGDGDMDVLSASVLDSKIAWYENDDNENFTTHIITTSADGATSVYAVDVDGDGDMDVLSASSFAFDSKIAWYENNGNENFTPHTITTDADGATSVYAVDVDGDVDMDVLSASWRDNKIAWYENLSPPIPVELTSFTASVSNGEVLLNWVTATETNNLGFEVERRNQFTNNGAWLLIGFVEGNGTTTESHYYSFNNDISSINASSLSFRLKQIDYNGVYEYSDEIYLDNLAPADYVLKQNYPNPFNPTSTIVYGIPITGILTLQVFNLLGEVVATLVNELKPAGVYEVEWNASGLTSGVYFYELKVNQFYSVKKMILLR